MTTSLPRVFPNSLSADGQKSANFAHHLKAPLGAFGLCTKFLKKTHTMSIFTVIGLGLLAMVVILRFKVPIGAAILRAAP